MTKKDPFSQFFDPDVSIRIQGDRQDALALMPQAQNLLRRATLFREAGQPVVKMWSEQQDGSLIWAFLHGPVKHLYVRPAPLKVKPPTVAPEEVVTPQGVVYLMLSGVVRPGTKVDVFAEDGTLVDERAHEFHPTQVCANVYDLEYAYQDMGKLGVDNPEATDLQSHYPKPSMYSGAMKRVVQALYGIGKTGATTMSRDVGGAGTTTVQNFYKCDWDCTHGIFRDSDGVWLIEISKKRGVLKMKLPLFDGTDADGYLDFLVEIGDSDTAGIVSEFGGLPNGETFPENDETSIPPVMALDDAIAAGDVIRLATDKDIAEYFTDSATEIGKVPLWGNCCWAFSESGAATSVHNTSFWYSQQGAATIWDFNRADATPHSPMRLELLEYDGKYPLSTVIPLVDRCARAEHWKIVLEGATAILSSVEKSLFAGEQKTLQSYGVQKPPSYLFAMSGAITQWYGRPPSDPFQFIQLEGENSRTGVNLLAATWREYWDQDCPVLVFYTGESLEVVRHKPERIYQNGFVGGEHSWRDSTAVGYDWQYLVPWTTFWDTSSGLNCITGRDYYDYTKWPPGEYDYHGLPGGEAHSTSNATYTVTETGPGGADDFNPCGIEGYDGPDDVLKYDVNWTGIDDQRDTAFLHDHFAFYGIFHSERSVYTRGLGGGAFETVSDVTTAFTTFTSLGFQEWSVARYEHTNCEGDLYDAAFSIGGTYVVDDFYLWTDSYYRRYDYVWKRAGAFYSSSLDLRRNEPYSDRHTYSSDFGSGHRTITFSDAAYWESSVGLVVPSYVREGYLFVKWDGGFLRVFGADASVQIQYEQLPETLTQKAIIPGLGNGVIDGPTLDPMTQSGFQSLCAPSHFSFEASVNAGPTKCGIIQDGVFADIIIFDYTGGYHTEALTPPASFLGTANGIPVDDCNAKDTTYIGAV